MEDGFKFEINENGELVVKEAPGGIDAAIHEQTTNAVVASEASRQESPELDFSDPVVLLATIGTFAAVSAPIFLGYALNRNRHNEKS